jgi:hypothetical protein
MCAVAYRLTHLIRSLLMIVLFAEKMAVSGSYKNISSITIYVYSNITNLGKKERVKLSL